MRVLFIHEGVGQFGVLHEHLNAEGLAHSWAMVSEGFYRANQNKIPNLVPFQIPAEEEKGYFYTKSMTARIQRSFLIRKAIKDLLEKAGLDIIVAHGSGGFPLQLFGDFDIPIISYIEFPSFTHHGHDPKYPMPEYAAYRDKSFEMTSYHQALKSDAVITPSLYAKKMFPDCVHDKIYPQMEGFNIKRQPSTFTKQDGYFYIGYTARDLSSAKGFEQFVMIAKEILKHRQKVKFVFAGAPKVLYSYETGFLQDKYPDEATRPESFMKYLFDREGLTLGGDGPFQHVDFASYDDFASYVEAMDLFLYPLQYGSANWGIFELLFRGRVIIGSNRCFMPEILRHRENALVCDYDDIDSWVRYAVEMIDNPGRYKHLGENAERDAIERFHIKAVTPRYLDIFNIAISRYRLGIRY